MKMFNIHELATGRQANNLLDEALAEAVSPWFDEVRGDRRVEKAMEDLKVPAKRQRALRFLGLELTPVA